MFSNKKIVLGITGGISAYKAADVASWLVKNGAEVHVVMTANATKFITPLVLQSLIGRPVVVDEFVTGHGWQVVHISVVDKANLMIVLPATANVIAKIAHGLADDALTSSVLAATCPLMMFPAMNVHMYENLATQNNLTLLKERGWHIIEPAEGRLACGTEGKGRLPDLKIIQDEINKMFLDNQDFTGKTVLITAGPTSEPIDPVRYITNKSSGKMGYALAQAAVNRGAKVILVSGKVNLQPPQGIEVIPVGSALEMHQQVLAHYEQVDIVIKAAAVADYRVENPSTSKIKKHSSGNCEDKLTLTLVKNPDILHDLGQKKTHQILVGFAAETNNVLEYATTKLKAKNLDYIVANDVSAPGAGFDVDTNIITVIKADGSRRAYEQCSKDEAANEILNVLAADFTD